MSTIQRINFELISDVIPIVRRDFQLADTTLVDPLNASVLIDGEWMIVNDAYKLTRATNVTAGQEGTKALSLTGAKRVRSFPLFAERGRTDVQALRKTIVLFGGWYEGETRIFDASARVSGGTDSYPAISYVGQPLQVATITIGTRILSGLVGANVDEFTADIPFCVGWVTRLPTNNGGKLRFRCEPCR
jgi:hypothetical protein